MPHRKSSIKIIDKKIEQKHINIFYPELKLNHRKSEYKINSSILKSMKNLLKTELSSTEENIFLYGDYKITLNKNNLLSFNIETCSYTEKDDSCFNTLCSLTIDTRNAYIFKLEDFFKKDSNYKNILCSLILKNIRDNNIPIIQEFANITENQNFYLTEDSLVIYYKIHRDSPYASTYCVPEFVIPFNGIRNIISFNGPINVLFHK